MEHSTDRTAAPASPGSVPDSDARLELAVRAARLGVWDWDLVRGTLVYSPLAREICGLPPGDGPLRLEQAQALTHPDDLPRTQAMLQRALDPAIREQLPYEYRVIRRDGSVRWLRALGEALFGTVDGQERAVRYIGTMRDITGERHLREALAASDARLRLAIDAGRMAVWEVDLRTDTVLPSPDLNRLLGFPHDAAPTTDELRAGHPPGEGGRLRGLVDEAIAQGERFVETEFRYLWPDGQARWFLLRAEIHRHEGEATRAVGVLVDITDRRQAEESLRSSEARLMLAQKVAGVGVWDWNVSSDAMIWSPQMYVLFGRDPATPVEPTRVWEEATHPDDRARVQAEARAAVTEGHPLDVEFRVFRSGAVRWLCMRGTTVAGDDAASRRMVGVAQDVTETRRQQEALEHQNRALQEDVARSRRERERIFELSQELFAVASLDGCLKVINPAWTQLLGYDPDTLRGRFLIELVHPEDRCITAAALDSMRRGAPVQRFETRLRRADDSWRWIAWTAVAEGELCYAVGRDITGQKVFAEELEAANRQLRQQIESRERVEETLRQMQRLEAVGQLTSGVAHDFNNLLTVVLGNLDLLEHGVDEAKAKRRLELIRQAALRGATLTSQLLAFSRRQRLEPKVLDLNGAVEGMGELLRSTMGGSVVIRTRLRPALWSALVDPTQIELVILNLAINARDAMPGGGSLTIETANETLRDGPRQPGEPGPGDYVVISVTDTGTGMDDAVRTRAFEPFFTTKDVGKGSGLGLAQVLGFAQQSGGGVRLDSAPGRGTTARVYLPRARADASSGAPDHDTYAGVAHPPARRLVVLVDDDSAVRDVTAARLRRLGLEVLEAGSGDAALDLLDRLPQVDLLVADFAMPGMNGVEVAEQARQRRPELPVLFVTGYADQSALAHVSEEHVVKKPYRDNELERKVRSVVGA